LRLGEGVEEAQTPTAIDGITTGAEGEEGKGGKRVTPDSPPMYIEHTYIKQYQ
jgi:hypothetical protein